MITYQEFEAKYYDDLVRCLEELQDYKISMDPDGFAKRKSGYGKDETDKLIQKITTRGGKILIVLDDGEVIGCGACELEPKVDKDSLEFDPIQFGEIKRLYVKPDFRGQGIGRELVKMLEKTLTELGCEYTALNVLSVNKSAHGLYENIGYNERYKRLIKKVK